MIKIVIFYFLKMTKRKFPIINILFINFIVLYYKFPISYIKFPIIIDKEKIKLYLDTLLVY